MRSDRENQIRYALWHVLVEWGYVLLLIAAFVFLFWVTR
jgi:hypothetical protein